MLACFIHVQMQVNSPTDLDNMCIERPILVKNDSNIPHTKV